MFLTLRLVVVLLLSLTALAPATACHAAPPAAAKQCDQPAAPARTDHRDAALAAPCIGCAVAPAVAIAGDARVALPASLAYLPPAASRLAGSAPAPDDRPPRATA